MGANSKIGWTHHTFNPWRGCTKATWTDGTGNVRLHPGCLNCYAEKDRSVRMHGIRWGAGQPRVPKADSGWAEPYSWARAAAKAGERHRVFCASLADVLDDEGLSAERDRLWPIVEETAWLCGGCGRPFARSDDADHRKARLLELDSVGAACEGMNGRCLNAPMGGLDFLVLTKRPQHWPWIPEHIRPFLWFGTSVSDNPTVNEWGMLLMAARGFRYRFLSVEPLIAPVALGLLGTVPASLGVGYRPVSDLINWVIVGGESGPRARPMDLDWARSIVDECRTTGVPVFVKQLGAVWAKSTGAMTLNDDGEEVPDKKGADMKNWPKDLQVQMFPGDSWEAAS